MKSKLIDYLRAKNKLSLRNVRTGQEMWHVFISRINLILAFVALFLVMFIVVLTIVAYTPVLDLIPGYPGGKSREALISNIMRLDSLEAEARQWENYYGRIARILDGQIPAESTDTLKRHGGEGGVAGRVPMDSVLRSQLQQPGPYELQAPAGLKSESSFEMLPPVRGVLSKNFAPNAGMNGVEIIPPAGQVVLAVLDGTVIQNAWNPTDGNTVVVQHAGNMISVYRQVARTLKKSGERIRAGEPIAVTGQLTAAKVPALIFELWYNGTPVDPENYITF